MISGTVACNSSGADFGLVMSAITNLDRPASNRTVSVKSFVSGLSKLKTMGQGNRVRGALRGADLGPTILPSVNRPRRRTPFLPIVSITRRIFSL